MKSTDKLRATWSEKQQDVILHFPLGSGTSSDGHYLAGVFNKAFTDELQDRGYNLATLKFSIEPHPTNKVGKFASMRKPYRPEDWPNVELAEWPRDPTDSQEAE